MEGSSPSVVVEADLSRRCYFAGDTVEVKISFCFPSGTAAVAEDAEPKDTETNVVIEWATVQLHGHVLYDRRLVSVNEVLHNGLSRIDSDESFDDSASIGRQSSSNSVSSPGRLFRRFSSIDINGRNKSAVGVAQWQEVSATGAMPDLSRFAGKYGFCMFLTEPQVLGCSIETKAGTVVNYIYRATLPPVIPPTYRGTSVRHWYMLSVGAKLQGSRKAHVLHVPVRVLAPYGIADDGLCSIKPYPQHDFQVESYSCDEIIDNIAVSNFDAFLKAPLHVIDSDLLGSWKRPSSFNATHVYKIGSEEKHMARLTIFKSAVCPGEDLLLCFDFSDASIPCYMVTVGLELEEDTKQEPPLQAAFAPLTTGPSGSSISKGKGPWKRTISSKHAVVLSYQTFNMQLQIPLDACPDFETELISVHSHLRFEFATAKRKEMLESYQNQTGSTPLKINNSDTQVCPWRIPLKVVAPERAERLAHADLNKPEEQATMLMELNRISGTNNSTKRRLWL